MLERLQTGEIGAEGEDPEVGLVAERDEAQRLVLTVGRERLDRLEDALRATGLGVEPGAVHAEEEVQHAPAARRLHRFHDESG